MREMRNSKTGRVVLLGGAAAGLLTLAGVTAAQSGHGEDVSPHYVEGTAIDPCPGEVSARALRWSLVPDGLDIAGAGFSNVEDAFTTLIDDDTLTVQQLFAQCFNRWANVSGITFQGGNDDGADWGQPGPHVPGDGCVFDPPDPDAGGPMEDPPTRNRGDIRVAMIPLDGPGGVVYVLSPDSGAAPDMGIGVPDDIILDAADFGLFPAGSQQFFEFFNVQVTQAIGVALGLQYDCPAFSSMMAPLPLLSTNLPQELSLDDVRAIQRLYGDNNEDIGNSFAVPVFLDELQAPGVIAIEDSSIHVAADFDIYRVDIPDSSADWSITAVLSPTGDPYADSTTGPVGAYPFENPGDGCGDADTTVLPSQVQDLNIEIYYEDDLNNPIATVDDTGTGEGEIISVVVNGSDVPGAYFILVQSDGAVDDIQMYDLVITIEVDSNESATDLNEHLQLLGIENFWRAFSDDLIAGATRDYTGAGDPADPLSQPIYANVEAQHPNQNHFVFFGTNGDGPSRFYDQVAWTGTGFVNPVANDTGAHPTQVAGAAAGALFTLDDQDFRGPAFEGGIASTAIARVEIPSGNFFISFEGLAYGLFGMADPTLLQFGENIPEDGVDVFNASYGAIGDATGAGEFALLYDAVVTMKDVTIVVAAGNSGDLNRTGECVDDVPENAPGTQFIGSGTVGTPATAWNVLSIGAAGTRTLLDNDFGNPTDIPLDPVTFSHLRVTGFSSKGPIDAFNYETLAVVQNTRPGIHLVAPGAGTVLELEDPDDENAPENARCTYVPNIALSGIWLPTFNEDGPIDNQQFDPDGTGTSFAAPVAAGTVALLNDVGADFGFSRTSTVLRAIMMNGSTKLPGWSNNGFPGPPQDKRERANDADLTSDVTDQPLDLAQGTGHINFQNIIDNYTRGTTDVDVTNALQPIFTDPAESSGFGGGLAAVAAQPEDEYENALGGFVPALIKKQEKRLASRRHLPMLVSPQEAIAAGQAASPEPTIYSPLGNDPPAVTFGGNDNPLDGEGGPSGADVDFDARLPAFPNVPNDPGIQAFEDLVITEIMYNPAQTPDTVWEFVEVFNPSPYLVPLTGAVLDNFAEFGEVPLAGSNITGLAAIPARSTAVLFNGDVLTVADMIAAWGDANWVPVTNWPNLKNDGDIVGIWQNAQEYEGDNVLFNKAASFVAYDNEAPWPVDDGISSIYVTDNESDLNEGSNWALSNNGTDGAYRSNPAGDNNAISIGSPGFVHDRSLVIMTEVMYNPASEPDAGWEFVELYNNSEDEAVDLTGWVLDHGFRQQETRLQAPNIAGGSVPPKTRAVLFNADLNTVEEFRAAWGEDVILIPVSPWRSLDNDGDTVALWADYTDYRRAKPKDDDFFGTVDFVTYTAGGAWPEPDARSSIALIDLQDDPGFPRNWELSRPGTNGAYRSQLAGINVAENFGSPGRQRATTGVIPVSFIGWDDASIGQADGTGFIDYLIDVPLEPGETLTVTLVWNRRVLVNAIDFSDPADPLIGDISELELEDLDLEIYSSDDLGVVAGLEAQSISTFNNVEHLNFLIGSPGFYVIRVNWSGTDYDAFNNQFPAEVRFGLAWRVSPDPDREFDFDDLQRLLSSYGSEMGDDTFDRWVDVVKDWKIDFQDLQAIIANWGN